MGTNTKATLLIIKECTGASGYDWVMDVEAARIAQVAPFNMPSQSPAIRSLDSFEHQLTRGSQIQQPPQFPYEHTVPIPIERFSHEASENGQVPDNSIDRSAPQMRLSTTGEWQESSPGVKFVPLALCFSRRLLEPVIVIQDDHNWDDRAVMKTIQQAYWKARGCWKRWFVTRKIWPWKGLHRIGYAKVRPSSKS